MANIRANEKNGKVVSYRFTACLERDANGKQVRRYTTWTPPAGLTPAKMKKAAERAADEWENEIRAEFQKQKELEASYALLPEKWRDNFRVFVDDVWFPLQICNGNDKQTTITFYKNMKKLIVEYFDGSYLQEITPIQIQKFLAWLSCYIGYWAFYGCSNLESITMGNCAISFGTSAFYNCKKLKQVNISDAASWCKSSFTDEDSTPLYYGGDLYIDGNLLTNLVIPSGSGVTKIPNYAFINCSGLESVTIPDGVTSIGSQAFDGCSGLRNVTIPASVTTIGYAAFQDCNDFDTVFYGGTVEQWYAIEISQCNDALYRADLKCICFHHSGTHFAAIAPTYDEGGNIEHWYCSGCGKYFSDAACTQELADVTLLPRAPDVTAALTADGVLTVTGALSENAATTNTVLLAVYQNGQLLCVKDISDLAQNELRFVCGDMQGADTVKLFRLGSGLEPCFAVCAIRIS